MDNSELFTNKEIEQALIKIDQKAEYFKSLYLETGLKTDFELYTKYLERSRVLSFELSRRNEEVIK